MPEVEEEDRRHLHRELADVKAERSREINRVKGLLVSQGILLTTRGKIAVAVEELRLWDGSPIPEGMQGRLRRAMKRLEFLNRQVEEFEGERNGCTRRRQT